MNRGAIWLLIVSFLTFGRSAAVPAATDCTSGLNEILAALQNEKTSNGAMLDLLRLGNDSQARKCLSLRLPILLDQYKPRRDGIPDLVWGNEARVAGELNIVDAAPVLARRIDMLTGPPSGGAQGYNFHERAAATALINIGAPAVPVVIEVLKQGNPLRREIAAHVLRYIGTDDSWRALAEALPGERDPKVRDRIKEALDSRR